MDRELTQIEQRSQNSNRWIWYITVISILIVGIMILRNVIQPNVDAREIVIAPLVRGSIENTITASGYTEPSFETQINASIATQINEVYLRPGDEVKKGDHILRLDQDLVELQVEGLEDELALKRNNVNKSAVEHQKRVAELQYDNDILALNIKSMRAAFEDLTRLKEVGGATEEEVQKAALDLEVQELEKKKLENDLLYSKKIFDRDQENLELEFSIKQKDLTKLRRKLVQTLVSSQTSGIVTWINSNIGEQVLEGSPLVRIADLSRFQIKGQIADRYAERLTIGQSVKIGINSRRFDGKITSILPEVINNTIEFIVEFNEQPGIELKPNMNVEIQLITEAKNNALLINNGPGYSGGKQVDLFIVQGDYAVRKMVNIGLVNGDFIEVLSEDLAEGDQVIISDMSRFERATKVKVKP